MIHESSFRLKRDGKPCKESYCTKPELIENYEKAKADNFKGWNLHHRLETHTSDGERRLVDISSKELIALDMYYNRPPEELIFLTKAEHKRLHNTSVEWKRKISEAMKGKQFSEEHKRMLSEAHKGKYLSDETKRKISGARKGKPHPHKGVPLSEETRKKISEALRGV